MGLGIKCPKSSSAYIMINVAIMWKDTGPPELLQFGELKAAVYVFNSYRALPLGRELDIYSDICCCQ